MSFEKVPESLRSIPQWVCHKNKQPYDPRSGTKAKANAPSTWTDFYTCSEYARMFPDKYDGVGFEIQPLFVGVDLDHVVDPITGVIEPWAKAIVDKLDSYTEYSPSGTGLHIFVYGTLPDGGNKRIIDKEKRQAIEMYGKNRYFTVTGNVLKDLPVCERQAELEEVFYSLIAKKQDNPTEPPPVRLNAPEYLRRGLEKDKLFCALYDGHRGTNDESSNDMALMNKLAYWCNGNVEQMIAAFRASPYAAQKDEEHLKKLQRDDYMLRTAQKAVQSLQSTAAADDEAYRQKRAQEAFAPEGAKKGHGRRLKIKKASEIPYAPPKWLIEPYFQIGRGTMIQAESGVGKTAFECKILACVTTGEPLVDRPINITGNVLLCSFEDDPAVLRGRIEANGGNLDKVFMLTEGAGVGFTNPEFEQIIQENKIILIAFDPIQSFIGSGIDMNKSNETRPVLAKLLEMCDRNNCACLIISHTGKGAGDRNAVYKSLGSVDIPAAMRSILYVVRNPANEDEIIAVHVKSSNAPKGKSISFTIGERGGVAIKGYSPITENDLKVMRKPTPTKIPYEHEPLVRVFNQMIADKPEGGFWSYADLKSEGAKIAGQPPFTDLNDLRQKLDGGLAKELQYRDGLIVTYGVKGKRNTRGIRIERYLHPESYQCHM